MQRRVTEVCAVAPARRDVHGEPPALEVTVELRSPEVAGDRAR